MFFEALLRLLYFTSIMIECMNLYNGEGYNTRGKKHFTFKLSANKKLYCIMERKRSIFTVAFGYFEYFRLMIAPQD